MGRTLGDSTYHDLLVWDGHYDSNLHLSYAFTYSDNVNRRTYFTGVDPSEVSELEVFKVNL